MCDTEEFLSAAEVIVSLHLQQLFLFIVRNCRSLESFMWYYKARRVSSEPGLMCVSHRIYKLIWLSSKVASGSSLPDPPRAVCSISLHIWLWLWNKGSLTGAWRCSCILLCLLCAISKWIHAVPPMHHFFFLWFTLTVIPFHTWFISLNQHEKYFLRCWHR